MADKIVSGWSLWLFAVLLLLIGGLIGALAFPTTIEKVIVQNKTQIVEVEVPTVDTGLLDRICELTDGCEFWESTMPHYWKMEVLEEGEDDLEDALLDLIGLDNDDLDGGFDYDIKDYQVRDYTSDDFEGAEGNWQVDIFMRVTYQDVDEADDDHIYVLVTSVFDEGDYEDLTVKEVSRNFEF